MRSHSLSRLIYIILPPCAAIFVLIACRTAASTTVRGIMKAWFNILWSYCLMVSASAVLLLLICSAIGYLPYSDRPGPGWGNIEPHFPALQEIKYFSSWALLLLPICYFMGTVLFSFMAWIKWLRVPTWLARILGGICCSGLSMLAVAAAGWDIAISLFVTNSVGVCALLFGVLVLPRISAHREMPLSRITRTVGVAIAFLCTSTYFAYPFLRR